jgi:hypothetical protein
MVIRLGIAVVFLLTLCGTARATTCGAVPYTFTNGTVADANQVNANFAALFTCGNTDLAPLASPIFTGTVTTPNLALASLADTSTAPTIASGGCTTGSAQSVSANNGTAAFAITLGGATCGSTITLTMPAAAHAWHCTVDDITTPASSEVHQTAASSTTAVVLTNYVRTTGVAGVFTGADVLAVSCRGY